MTRVSGPESVKRAIDLAVGVLDAPPPSDDAPAPKLDSQSLMHWRNWVLLPTTRSAKGPLKPTKCA